MTYEGETKGYDLPDFLRAIDEHTYPFRVYDRVLVNSGAFYRPGSSALVAPGGEENNWVIEGRAVRLVRCEPALYPHAPFKIIAQDVVNPAYPIRHDSRKLGRALLEILKEG